MYGKRLALGATVVALVVGVSGALSNSAGSLNSRRPVLLTEARGRSTPCGCDCTRQGQI
jgi:hypothetical protein